jgi:hypothetical protein
MSLGDEIGILFVAVLTVLPAAIMIWFGAFFSRPEFLHDRDHCRKCGYCLTGNTSGTCPECGGRIREPK